MLVRMVMRPRLVKSLVAAVVPSSVDGRWCLASWRMLVVVVPGWGQRLVGAGFTREHRARETAVWRLHTWVHRSGLLPTRPAYPKVFSAWKVMWPRAPPEATSTAEDEEVERGVVDGAMAHGNELPDSNGLMRPPDGGGARMGCVLGPKHYKPRRGLRRNGD